MSNDIVWDQDARAMLAALLSADESVLLELLPETGAEEPAYTIATLANVAAAAADALEIERKNRRAKKGENR